MNEVTTEEDKRVTRTGDVMTTVGQSSGFWLQLAGRTRQGKRLRGSGGQSRSGKLRQLEGPREEKIRRDPYAFRAQRWRIVRELARSPLDGERRADAAAREENVACIIEAPPLVHVVVKGKEDLETLNTLKRSGCTYEHLQGGAVKGKNLPAVCCDRTKGRIHQETNRVTDLHGFAESIVFRSAQLSVLIWIIA